MICTHNNVIVTSQLMFLAMSLPIVISQCASLAMSLPIVMSEWVAIVMSYWLISTGLIDLHLEITYLYIIYNQAIVWNKKPN